MSPKTEVLYVSYKEYYYTSLQKLPTDQRLFYASKVEQKE